jgi:ABC-type sulfate transport system permease component
MSWIDVIGWVAVAGVLTAYALKNGKHFDLANAFLWLPVALPALVRGAYNGALLNACFGVIGTVHLWRARVHRRG